MFTDGLTPVIRLYDELINRYYKLNRKPGHPYNYSQLSFLLFFTMMFIKKIHKFKAMTRYVHDNYRLFFFEKPPSRQTIRRRFLALPEFIQNFLKFSLEDFSEIDERFTSKVGFIDKCLFWAKGGILHKKQINTDFIPNRSIDLEASWGYSPYHKWVYGYAIHLVSNIFRFPMSAVVTTGREREYKQVNSLVKNVKELILLIGDKGYRAMPLIKSLLRKFHVFLISTKVYKDTKDKFKREYSYIVSLSYAKYLFFKRKTSVEPVFSTIKELFCLTYKEHLPYKSLAKNKAYLMMMVFIVQFMFVYNSVNNKNLCSINYFRGEFL